MNDPPKAFLTSPPAQQELVHGPIFIGDSFPPAQQGLDRLAVFIRAGFGSHKLLQTLCLAATQGRADSYPDAPQNNGMQHLQLIEAQQTAGRDLPKMCLPLKQIELSI